MSARFDLGGRSLREHTARGALVNTAFAVGLSALGLLRAFALAIFLTREDYGVWGIVIVSLGIMSWLKQVGIGDRFVQQDEPDQELAFQRAFTLDLALNVLAGLVMAALLPVVAAVYGRPELLLPGYVCLLILPAGSLQMPIWIHYRRMAFVRQRALQAVDPVVALLVGLAVAAAGGGYWALVAGTLAGAWTAGIAATVTSPYRLRLRFDRRSLRDYGSFSWPLFVAGAGGMVVAQGSYLSTEAVLGLAAAGAVSLASTVAHFSDRVDGLITSALYPAICAVRDRRELLLESFVKSNRLALMWAVPFGFGLALFAEALVRHVIGPEWRPAVVLLQAFGVTAALNHIGFNWTAYFRALGDTRPMAVASLAAAAVFLATAIPLLHVWGLEGFAVGIGAQAAAHVAVRSLYLRRLFAGFGFVRHAARAVLPTLPGAAYVLAARALRDGPPSALLDALDVVVYAVVTAAVTWRFEGRLLREAASYVRRRTAAVEGGASG